MSEPKIVIGAGAAGQMVTKELLLSNRINAKPVCIIDDNSNKWNRYIDGCLLYTSPSPRD